MHDEGLVQLNGNGNSFSVDVVVVYENNDLVISQERRFIMSKRAINLTTRKKHSHFNEA